jgi:vesicle transport protein SEC22
LQARVNAAIMMGLLMSQSVELTHNAFLFIVLQVIQRKRRDFLDPSSRDNMARLNNDLADIHDIMKKNIQEV